MKEKTIFFMLIGGWVALQVWFLSAHWINPDEGAHLMDVQLLMDGLVPGIDYGARQPFYVLSFVPFLRWLPGGFVAGRVMPVLATLCSAGLLYLIARRCWGHVTGLCTVVLFLFSPTILFNTAVVKTEPLAILLVSVALYSVIRNTQGGSWVWLGLAGVACGLGYYVRESTLGGLLAATIVIGLGWRDGVRSVIRRFSALYAGWFMVCGAVLALYTRVAPLERLLRSKDFSPFKMVAMSLGHIAGWKETSPGDSVAEAARMSAQSWETTLRNLTEPVLVNLPLLVGVVVAVAVLTGGWRWWTQRLESRDRFGLGVALAWLGSFALLYAYYTVHRGFFQYYFRELLAPMALLLGFVLARGLQELGWERRAMQILPAGLGVGAGIWLIQGVLRGGGALFAMPFIGVIGWAVFHGQWPSTRAVTGYVTGFVLLTGVAVTVRFLDLPMGLQDWSSGGFLALVIALTTGLLWWCAGRPLALAGVMQGSRIQSKVFSFILLSAIAGSVVLSASHGARIIQPLSYDCAWSPQTVASVVSTIQAHSQPEDEVMSGAVIWEFQAGRRPFANISHPLGMVDRISPRLFEKIQRAVHTQPPRLIVMDGYTEKTYFRQVGEIQDVLDSSYQLLQRLEGSRYPVSVYALVQAPGRVGGEVARD